MIKIKNLNADTKGKAIENKGHEDTNTTKDTIYPIKGFKQIYHSAKQQIKEDYEKKPPNDENELKKKTKGNKESSGNNIVHKDANITNKLIKSENNKILESNNKEKSEKKKELITNNINTIKNKKERR